MTADAKNQVFALRDWKVLLGPMRAPFLLLTPSCVAVGVGAALYTSGHVSIIDSILILLASLAGHICVNAYNEYFDFQSGLDSRTERTPFSGGSGTLQATPALAPIVFILATGAGALTGIIGLYFAVKQGWALLPLWVLGLAVAYAYTKYLTKNALICLVAPGVGFGIVMVLSAQFALTGQYTWEGFVASLVPFFLVNNLLLINQFPDVDADRTVGKKHFPLIIGRRRSAYIYGAFLLAAYLSVLLGVVLGLLPPASLIILLTLPLALRAIRDAVRFADDIPHLIPTLGLNVIITLLTPLLLALGLVIG